MFIMKLSFATAVVCLVACNKDASSTTTNTSASGQAAEATPKATTKQVDLAPLSLTITVPKDESGMTMDMSMDAHKSVSMSYEAVNAGINVSVPMEKSFDEVKKGAKADKIMFPFKRWVKEDGTTAVEEFTNEGKSGYLALSWTVISGKSYVCKSNGLSGLKSPEDADTVLKTCDTLATKP